LEIRAHYSIDIKETIRCVKNIQSAQTKHSECHFWRQPTAGKEQIHATPAEQIPIAIKISGVDSSRADFDRGASLLGMSGRQITPLKCRMMCWLCRKPRLQVA